MGKLGPTQYKGRNSAVKSSLLSWAGQYTKCVQYDFNFTSEYSVEWRAAGRGGWARELWSQASGNWRGGGRGYPI